jgi:AbrB family looped-hinge helix DNA binding protein
MEKVKLSSKNQIVIPTSVRRGLRLSKGAKLAVYQIDDSRAIICKEPQGGYATALWGLGKDMWKELGGSEKYLENERNSWDK